MNAVVDADAQVRDYSPVERIPQHSLRDLKGMDAIQTQLMRKVIRPFAHIVEAAEWNLVPPRGVLLYGPPGTGKTALADAIVRKIEEEGRLVNYYHETGTCMSSYLGETENNLRSLFQLAKENAPSVIFLDELDGLGKGRSKLGDSAAAMHTVLSTLLVQINDLPVGHVLVIAATNCVHMCDQALIRKGRIDQVIEVPAPGPQEREKILDHYFILKDINLSPIWMLGLKERTTKMTGADLRALVDDISENALERVLPDGAWYLPMTAEQRAERKSALEDIDWDVDIEPALQNATKKFQTDSKSSSKARKRRKVLVEALEYEVETDNEYDDDADLANQMGNQEDGDDDDSGHEEEMEVVENERELSRNNA